MRLFRRNLKLQLETGPLFYIKRAAFVERAAISWPDPKLPKLLVAADFRPGPARAKSLTIAAGLSRANVERPKTLIFAPLYKRSAKFNELDGQRAG